MQEGDNLEFAAGAAGNLDDVADLVAWCTRDRQDDLIDLVFDYSGWDRLTAAVDGHAEDTEGVGLAVVVDDHNRGAAVVVLLQLTDQLAACRPCADDHDATLACMGGGRGVMTLGAGRLAVGLRLADAGGQAGQRRDVVQTRPGLDPVQPGSLAGAIGGNTVEDPYTDDQDEGQQPVDDIHRTGKLLLLCQAQSCDQAKETRLDQGADKKNEVLAHAGEAPELVVEAKDKVDQPCCSQVMGPALGKVGCILCGHGEVEAKLEGQVQRQIDQPQVDKDRDNFIETQAAVTNTDHKWTGLLFPDFTGVLLGACALFVKYYGLIYFVV